MPFPRVLIRCARGRVDKLTLRLAGHLAFADLEHIGRVSGTVRHTPLRAFRTDGTVVIGINFGRESDWLKNIRAAGRCRMRLGGEQLEPVEQGVRGMPWLFGTVLRYVVHTAECVELPVLASTPAGRPAGPGA